MAKTKSWTAWTSEEDAILKEVFASDRPIKSVASQLSGHSVAAIYMRRTTLGLGARGKVKRTVNAPTGDRILRFLDHDGPHTAQDIAERLKMTVDQVRCAVYAARRRKVLYIQSYERQFVDGPASPLFAAGKGRDAKRPKPCTRQELWRRSAEVTRRKRATKCLTDDRLDPMSFVVRQAYMGAIAE